MRRLVNGSALISALFIMTLVAIAATAMSARLQLDIYRTQLTLLSDKLYLASQGINFWAMGELNKSKLAVISAQDKLMDFPKQYQSYYPNLTMSGAIYDLQGRFNLNNLVDKKNYFTFLQLLEQIAPKTSPQERKALGLALQHWVNAFKLGVGNDEWFSFYLKQKPPYFPSQQLLQSVTELKLIKGFNYLIYQSLEKYITVLPQSTPININIASKKVLQTLGNGLTNAQANEIINTRGQKGIDPKKLEPLLKKFNIRKEQVTLESEYFMSAAMIKSQDLTLISYAFYKRTIDKKKHILVSLLKESFNTY